MRNSCLFLLLISTIALNSPAAQAAGKAKLLISGGYLSPALAGVSYAGSEVDEGNTGGHGFMLDFFGGKNKRSSFALDFYAQNGGRDLITERENFEDITRNRQISSYYFLLGGRHHFAKSGFYIGGGLAPGEYVERVPTAPEDKISGGALFNGLSFFPLAATLGYDFEFDNKLILGANFFVADAGHNLAPLGRPNDIIYLITYQTSLSFGFAW